MELTLFCPRMAIRRDGIHRKRTATEPMIASLDGIQIGTVTIGETEVRQPNPLNPFYWLVDACNGIGSGIIVELPEEPCSWDWYLGKMVARSIIAPVNGSYKGLLVFPDCPIDNILLPTCYAEPITAKGTVQL